jgi:hypothetical protein
MTSSTLSFESPTFKRIVLLSSVPQPATKSERVTAIAVIEARITSPEGVEL